MTEFPKIEHAIECGVAFLRGAQTPEGEIPSMICERPEDENAWRPDPSIFPTALAGYALRFVESATPIVERAIRFLLEQRTPTGVWHHWRRDHPGFTTIPTDVDDTSCASLLLNRHGVAGAADRSILLHNRNRQGLFYTWFLPRLRWTSGPHRRVMLEQLRLIRRQGRFFRNMSAADDDVDAVVNANCLYALGSFRGDQHVINYLLTVLRAGAERSCDKWYANPFAVWYFFSRALRDRAPDAADLIAARLATLTPQSALDIALAISTTIACGRRPTEEWISRLVAGQLESGAWPRAIIYTGGRIRGSDGELGEYPVGTPYFGSEAVTTAFCLEALAHARECLTG